MKICLDLLNVGVTYFFQLLWLAYLKASDAVEYQFDTDKKQHRVSHLKKEAIRYTIVQPYAQSNAKWCERRKDERGHKVAGVELTEPCIGNKFDAIDDCEKKDRRSNELRSINTTPQ